MTSIFFKRDLVNSYARGYNKRMIPRVYDLLYVHNVEWNHNFANHLNHTIRRETIPDEHIRLIIDRYAEHWGAFGLSYLCYSGRTSLVNYLMSKTHVDPNHGLCGACEGGHHGLVDLLIKRGADSFKWGFMSACRGGHLDLARKMRLMGGGLNRDVINGGLERACGGGHRSVVDWLITLGADDWDAALDDAIDGSHEDIINLMIEHGAWVSEERADRMLWHACDTGKLSLAKRAIELGAKDFDSGLMASRSQAMKDLMREHGARHIDADEDENSEIEY